MNKTFGEYNLLRLLGESKSTKIFLAEHQRTNKRIALKFVRDVSVEWRQGFLGGVRKAATLLHPNITQIEDWGIEKTQVFEISEYVHGRDLQKVAERGFDEGKFFPVPLAVSVIASVAAGLHYAHSRQDSEGVAEPIFHEDICPSNVILRFDGNVKLTDFAVGRFVEKLLPVPGRLSYRSPEQIDEDYGQIDARSDVFSLGAVAYELITCKRLFRGESNEDTFNKILSLPIMAPHHVRAEVDPELSEIIMKALVREPTLRYQNVRDFQMSLVDWLSSQDSHTTDAHIAAYMSSLFPEKEAEQEAQENSSALIISEEAFQNMDASTGVDFEKWADKQSIDQEIKKVDAQLPNENKDESKTDIGLPNIELAESEAQYTQEFFNDIIDDNAAPSPDKIDKLDDLIPESRPKKKINLAELPMPTLSFSLDANQGDFDVPPIQMTDTKIDLDSEPETTVFNPDASSRRALSNEDQSSIVEKESFVAPIVDPVEAVQSQNKLPPSSISSEIQRVGPGGFRPGSVAIKKKEKKHSLKTQPKTSLQDLPLSEPGEFDHWTPSSGKKGFLYGVLFLGVVAIFGGGLYFAMQVESTLENDVGGRKISVNEIKLPPLPPPPKTHALPIKSEIEGIHYIVNGKVKDLKDGKLPVYEGITNEVIAMAPGHLPRLESVYGEDALAPLEFALTPMELELDTELQIVSEPRGATLFVDGEKVGTTPKTIKLSRRIEHHVEIRATGRQTYAAFIGLTRGKDNIIDVHLNPDKSHYVGVDFRVLPRGSSIKLNGVDFAISPIFKKLKGNRIIRIDMSQVDSVPMTRRVALVDIGTFEMRPLLKKIPREKGWVSFELSPKGSEIYIGPNGYGIGPIRKLKLRAGKLQVVIDGPHGRIKKMIEVLPNKHVKYKMKLKGKKAKLTKKISRR